MKVLNPLKTPFGKGKFSRVRDVCYRQWEDTFEVEFDDGLAFLEPHETIRMANKIAPGAVVERVERDDDLRHGFFVHYNNGQTAEVSWSFIRELPPGKSASYELRETGKMIAREPAPKHGRTKPEGGKR